jgi:phosphatidate cytidylyltransferase
MSDDITNLFGDEEDEAPPTPSGGGLRITGAEQAGEDLLADWGLSEPESVDEPVVATELPHWTENPTGQVPTILRRDEPGSDDPWASVQSPTWREDDSDWVAEEEAFDPSLLSVEEPPPGALNAEQDLAASQPWEFELPDERRVAAPATPLDADGPRTEQVPVVTSEPRQRRGRERGAQSRPRRRGDPTRPSRPEADDAPATAAPSGTSGRNMPVAIVTGAIIAVLVLVTFDIGTVLAMALVLVVVTLATAEGYAALRRGGQHPATLLGLVATISLLLATYNKGSQALGLVTVLLFAFTVVWFMAGHERSHMLVGLSSTMLGFLWIAVFGSYAALLLNPNLFPNRHGLAFLLGAILTSIAYDIAALFIGSSIGRRPLAPAISPAKTVEGLIGGSAAAILMGVIVVQMIHPWTFTSALTLGIVVAIVAPLGDLAESMIKRGLGIKDMGRLLPGHGGMLDRVDGLLFVLPATYYLVRAFHLG